MIQLERWIKQGRMRCNVSSCRLWEKWEEGRNEIPKSNEKKKKVNKNKNYGSKQEKKKFITQKLGTQYIVVVVVMMKIMW